MNNSNPITSSASKIVLLSIIAVLCILALVAGILSVFRSEFGEAAKVILSLFGSAVSFVMGYYFGRNNTDTVQNTDTPEVESEK